MCGVIGFKGKASQEHLDLIKKLFLETEIRGKHATGISWLKAGKIHTEKQPVGAEEFLQNFDLNQIIDNDTISMIGHIRYSTSDVRYNQPFSNKQFSIVHNGVISQEPSDKWPIKCETENDSEMILHCISNRWSDYKHPLLEFPESSQAVVVLSKEGHVSGWRNEQRPLWYAYEKAKYGIFSSTQDILKRCGISGVNKTEMYNEYSFMWDDLHISEYKKTNKKDLQ